jgi:hypothetical protein
MSYNYLRKEIFEILSITFEREIIEEMERREHHCVAYHVTKCVKQRK